MGSSDSDAGGDEGKGNMLPMIIGGVVLVAAIGLVVAWAMGCFSSGGGGAYGDAIGKADEYANAMKAGKDAADTAKLKTAAEDAYKKVDLKDKDTTKDPATLWAKVLEEAGKLTKESKDMKDYEEAKKKFLEKGKEYEGSSKEKDKTF